MILPVLIETADGALPDGDGVAAFEERLGLDALHVLGDYDGTWIETWAAQNTARHSYAVMDADRVIVWRKDDGNVSSVEELAEAVKLAE